MDMFLSTVASQYFVGSALSLRAIRSAAFLRLVLAAPLIGAVRTRTRAKRERSLSFVPSRQVIVRQACFGRLSANCLDAQARAPAHHDRTLYAL